MVWGSGAIFVFVMVLLAVALRRVPRSATERFWFWGLGVVFPLAILASLTLYGLILGQRLAPVPAPDLVRVEAEARQWAWTFRYADAPGLVTHDLLHIPAGRPVDVDLTSVDVIHSFWVPRLAGKLDAIPGHVNRLRLSADQPGDYAGASAEFSGRGYTGHVFSVRAHAPADWQAFLQGMNP